MKRCIYICIKTVKLLVAMIPGYMQFTNTFEEMPMCVHICPLGFLYLHIILRKRVDILICTCTLILSCTGRVMLDKNEEQNNSKKSKVKIVDKDVKKFFIHTYTSICVYMYI